MYRFDFVSFGGDMLPDIVVSCLVVKSYFRSGFRMKKGTRKHGVFGGCFADPFFCIDLALKRRNLGAPTRDDVRRKGGVVGTCEEIY